MSIYSELTDKAADSIGSIVAILLFGLVAAIFALIGFIAWLILGGN